MPPARLFPLTTLAMLAFAGNSLLCRAALKTTPIDVASFTTIRLISGALMLWLLVHLRQGSSTGRGNWLSALALFAYAAGFSFAYVSLPTATGALLLFGAVQTTMNGYGLYKGERFLKWQLVGLVLACGGLGGPLPAGPAAPPLLGPLTGLRAGGARGVGPGGGQPGGARPGSPDGHA